ncbi:MAG TPA: DNA-3-methyladenine glycosidase [Rhizobium sp.]|nr:DNA-3-methyladenine glycosidase [Rhizobium sp.]
MVIIRTEHDIEAGLLELLEIDPRLKGLAAMTGPLPLRLLEPGFAGLAHIIVSQMVSKASAEAIWRRIVDATGSPDALTYLALDEVAVSTLGLSRAKAATLRLVAEAIVSGQLDLGAVARLEAPDAVERLTSLRGVGLWTAEVYLMFCGGHPDVFPAGDVALRTAVGNALGHETRPGIRTVAQIAEAWRPWRSVAARLFWAYYAVRLGRDGEPAGELPQSASR